MHAVQRVPLGPYNVKDCMVSKGNDALVCMDLNQKVVFLSA